LEREIAMELIKWIFETLAEYIATGGFGGNRRN
jgi:hypothetical protein